MSAKGLPPAVRLDPLVPLPLPSTCHPHCHQLPEYDAKSFQPPQSQPYVFVEAPKSMSKTPPISNIQAAHVKPRGLTPIIITPSSSRAPTPVQLLPLPPALALPQSNSPALGKPKPKKIKIEHKVGPVDLTSLVPTRGQETPKVMAVIDDDELEQAEERMHVRQDRNRQAYRQLPTPHTSPPIQAFTAPERGCKAETGFEYTSPHTGKVISFPPLSLGEVHPLSLDPDTRPHTDSRFCERRLERDREEVERGRKKERGPSRFRNSKERHRPAPYDPKSRPVGALKNIQKEPEECIPRAFTGQLKLGDIAAAAALAMKEADRVNSASGSTGSAGDSVDSVSSNRIPISSTTSTMTPSTAVHSSSSMASSAILAQQNMPTPTPTPPQHCNSARQASAQPPPPHQQRLNGNHASGSLPSNAIHSAADEMIKLFSNELQAQMARECELMQEHLSRERENLAADIQREREALEQVRAELQKEREHMQREREALRGEVEKEIREENEALRTRVVQLQAALDVMQGGRV